VIGTSVYGLGTRNTASVIRGEFGNFYTAYRTAIHASSTTRNASLETALPSPNTPAVENAEIEIEGFIDVMKKIARVIGSQVSPATLAADSSSNGPLGGITAGTALCIVSAAAKDDHASQVSSLQYRQFACRAVMAEAALQAVLRMDPAEANEYGVIKKMGDIYSSNQNMIGNLASALAPSLDSALRLAVSDDKQVEGEQQAPFPAIASDPIKTPDGSIGKTDEVHDVSKSAVQPDPQPSSSFAKDLHDSAIANGASAESLEFLDEVSSASDKAGVTDLSNIGSCLETIAAPPAGINSLDALQPDHITLCQRAFLGEAALQTITSMPSEVRVNGFFDFMRDTVTKIGPKVGAKVAERIPALIESLTPLVEKVNSGNKAPLAPEPVPILGRPVRSILDRLTNGS
jgi:hypothetical protein